MAWTRTSGASARRSSSGGWFSCGGRKRWREFEPATGEVITPADASHIGLPLPWYQHFVDDHFEGREVRAEQLRFAIDDPSIRDLLRFKIQQRQLLEDLEDVLDQAVNPYDAIAAGVADAGLAAVVRDVFPDRTDVTVRELIPEVVRRAVRTLLVGKDGRPSVQRVRRALERAADRQVRVREFDGLLDRRLGIEAMIQVGAASSELRGLAREWFGESETISVGQLLLAAHVPAFARVLGWQRMISNLEPVPASR